MAQTAIPISDVSTGGWTPTPVFTQIKTPAPPDVKWVSSVVNPSQQTFVVNLAALAWPVFGAETVQVRLRSTTSEPTNVGVGLLQGNVLIAFWIVQTTAAFTTHSLALKPSQIQQITDYTNLRLEVIAGIPVSSSSSSSCLTNACCGTVCLPEILHCTIPSGTGSCSCLVGSYVLELATSPISWGTHFTACGGNDVEMGLVCQAGKWVFTITCNHGLSMFNNPSSTKCSPFQLTFSLSGNIAPCCNGAVGVIITS